MDKIESLKDKILSEENIYNAIYSLDSYIQEKGLLNTESTVCDSDGNIICLNDLELFYALADKYNVVLIKKVIDACHKRLEEVLSDKEDLFNVTVYFKPKDADDDNNISFRPMHTARLIDLICMVSILNCLMFEDDGDRQLSDLSKLLPHNFYGNIPSTDVRYLFHRWQNKYKEYTKEVIEHCREYQSNHKYMSEVCLDIKNFFPSISPAYLHDLIVRKLSSTYRSDEDNSTLRMAVAKLLYFRIDKENIEPWLNCYYGEDPVRQDGYYMNRGVSQGLPQSYFFGNLCMIDIKKILMQDECFNGDSYFYVDDSVIYVQASLKADDFSKRVNTLNAKVKKWCDNFAKITDESFSQILSKNAIDFQQGLRYMIVFHEDDKKSVFSLITETDNQLGGIENIAEKASDTAAMSLFLDEVDDNVSLSKLNALDTVITAEIKRIEDEAKKKGETSVRNSSRLKSLHRYKKFFLYRNRRLKIRVEGGPKDDTIDDFSNRYLGDNTNAKEWFNMNEAEIFCSEYRLLMQQETEDKAKDLRDKIIAFEQRLFLSNNSAEAAQFLYYSKDADAALKMKELAFNVYESLKRWAKKNFSGLQGLGWEKQMKKFREFLFGSGHNMFNNVLDNPSFTRFIGHNSADYQRRILNTFFSTLIGVEPTDSMTFTGLNARRLHYTELRILAFLRNKNFNLEQFKSFVHTIKEKDVSNSMGIDMGLLEALNIFITKVRNPEWVDNLILTHRLTKGLWYNGSKFLNSYTLHNEEHAVTLVNKSMDIVNRIDYFSLKNVDFYILFLACYLHDISMVIHPDLNSFASSKGNALDTISELMDKMQEEVHKFSCIDSNDTKDDRIKQAGKFIVEVFNKVYEYFENDVRNNHPKDSAKFIIDKSTTLLSYLQPTLLSQVAKVSESHGYDVMEVYGLRSRAKDDTVSLKYLMMIIRLADSLDVANDRVNYSLLRQNINNLSLTSKFHWISHLVTDRIEMNTDYDSNTGKKLNEKPITETINFDLYLNVKYLTSENCKRCESREAKIEDDHIKVRILGKNKNDPGCESEHCTLLCRWMMKKHEWLIQELVELNNYLFSANDSLIRSKICFNIYFSNDINLDADMFDYVQEFLMNV